MLARYPVLADGRVLSFRAAMALAAVAITLVTGLLLRLDGVDAKGIITGGH